MFKEKRKLSQQQYSLLLQTIFEKPGTISQTRRSPNNEIGRPTLLPTYLCLQCPSVHDEAQRNKHWQSKGHAFCKFDNHVPAELQLTVDIAVESRNGYLYCQECDDFVYDPAMEEIRQQKGMANLFAVLILWEDAYSTARSTETKA